MSRLYKPDKSRNSANPDLTVKPTENKKANPAKENKGVKPKDGENNGQTPSTGKKAE